MNHNVVVLLDLNCFPVEDESSKDSFMKWIHHYLLTMFAKVATTESDGSTNYSRIKWSYKLFNSAKEKNYPSKAVHQFNFTSFETFESSSKAEFEKYLPESQESTFLNKCSCLSKALKDIMADCGLPEAGKTEEKTLNSVYAFLRVPRNEEELADFLDTQDDFEGSPNPNSRMLLNALLPPAFLKQFRKMGIQLNMIDMGMLYKESNLETEWDGKTYSKQIVKVVDYLNKGKVLQFEKPQEVAMPMGLPSYFQLLKQALKGIDSDSASAARQMQKKVTQSKADSSTADKPRIKHEDSFNTSFNSSNSRMKSMKSRGDEQRSGSYRRMPYGGKDGMSDLLPDTQSGTDDSSVSESYPMEVFGRRGDRDFRLLAQAHASSSRRTQIFKEPARRHHPRDRLYASADQPTKRPKPANLEVTSRTAQLRSLAVSRENRKWRIALEKEEQERNALRMERLEVSVKSETALALMRAKLEVFFERAGVSPLDCTLEDTVAAVREYEEFYIPDESKCVLAVGQAAVQVVVEKVKNTRFKKKKIEEECDAKQLLVDSTSEQQRLKDFYAAKKQEGKEVRGREMHGRAELLYTETHHEEKENERRIVEQTLFVPITELRSKIRECKNDEKKFKEVFRLCQYQIVVRMETSFLLPVTADVTDDLRDEMVDLLNLLSIHVKKEVDDFVNHILLQGYLETHSEMLIRLFRGLSLDPPRQLMLVCTPSKSLRSRCSFRAGSSIASPFGSMESLLFAAPSASQSRVKAGPVPMTRLTTESSLGGKSSKSLARHKSHLSVNNPKKMLVVSVRNVKKFGVSGSMKPKPKSPKPPSGGRSRVRRNLMNDLRSPAKSLKSSERPTRSPSVAGRGNVFLMRNLRSKRKLEWEEEDDQPRKICRLGSSPEMFSPEGRENEILCPGTPSDRSVHSTKKIKKSPYGMSPGNYLIAASPECQKEEEDPKKRTDGFQATSFYSNGTDSSKSRMWEQSGNGMMPAKVKRDLESSSFMQTGLTIHDIEILGGCASSPESNKASGFRRSSESFKYKTPSTVSTVRNVAENVEVVKSNASPCIAALIRSNQSIATLKTTPKCEAPLTATPSKKIKFNFNSEIPRTPKSNSSPGTPKSILKTPSRYESADSYTPKRNVRAHGQIAVRELADHFSPTRDDDVEKYPNDSIEADFPSAKSPTDLAADQQETKLSEWTDKLRHPVVQVSIINTEAGSEFENDAEPTTSDQCAKISVEVPATQSVTHSLNESIFKAPTVDRSSFPTDVFSAEREEFTSSTDGTRILEYNTTCVNSNLPPEDVQYSMTSSNTPFGYPQQQNQGTYFYDTIPYSYGLVYDVVSPMPPPLAGYVPATYVSSPAHVSIYQQAPVALETSSGLANLTTCEPSTLGPNFTELFESVSNSDVTQGDGMLKSGNLSFSGMFNP